jgi:hypothetical protein
VRANWRLVLVGAGVHRGAERGVVHSGLHIQKDLCRNAIQAQYVTVTEVGGYGGVIWRRVPPLRTGFLTMAREFAVGRQ